MKKFRFVLLAMIMACILFSCKDPTSGINEPTPGSNESTSVDWVDYEGTYLSNWGATYYLTDSRFDSPWGEDMASYDTEGNPGVYADIVQGVNDAGIWFFYCKIVDGTPWTATGDYLVACFKSEGDGYEVVSACTLPTGSQSASSLEELLSYDLEDLTWISSDICEKTADTVAARP